MLHYASLLTIGVIWLLMWRAGSRWCHACGVIEPVARWTLATILPASGLVLAVHVMAHAALLLDAPLVAPEPIAVLFLSMFLLTHRWIRRTRAPAVDDPVTTESENARSIHLLWPPLAVVGGLYLVFLVEALTRYPTGYDGLFYHLPQAVRWMQTGRMNLISGELYHSLPENGMIIPMLLAFGRLERLLPVTNVPNMLVLLGAVYGLASSIGTGRRGATAAVCITASIPIVLFQTFSSYIDLYGATAWLVSLLALLWASRTDDVANRRALLLMAGLSAGIALGTKSTYLVLVALLVVVASVVPWLRSPRAAGIGRRCVRSALLFGASTLVCSSFWFVRGAVQAGNPIYPFGVSIGDMELLPGYDATGHTPDRPLGRKLAQWVPYPWQETNYAGTGYAYGVNNAVGAAFTTFVPLGVLAVLIGLLVQRPRDAVLKWRMVLTLLAASGALLLLTLFTEVLRYVYPLVVVAACVSGVFLARLIDRFPRPTVALLTGSLGVTAVVAVLPPVTSLAGRIHDGDLSRSWFYQIPAGVERFEAGSRVLNLAPPPLTYPLLGSRYRNVVLSAPVWHTLVEGRPLSAETLQEQDIDYVFVRGSMPEDWPPDLSLQLIYDDTHTRKLATTPATRIYRVGTPPGEHLASSSN